LPARDVPDSIVLMPDAIDTVFFDIGGVLINLRVQEALALATARCQRPPSDVKELLRSPAASQVLKLYGRGQIGTSDFLKDMQELWRAEYKFEGSLDVVSAVLTEYLGDPIVENAELLLSLVRGGGVKVGIISDNNAAHTAIVKTRLKPVFEAIVPAHILLSQEVGCRKEDGPEIFQVALRAFHTSADRAVMIDDIDRYLAVAKQLGFGTIQYMPGMDLSAQLRALGVGAKL